MNLGYVEEQKNGADEADDFMMTTDQLGAMTDSDELEEINGQYDIDKTAYQLMKTKDSFYGMVRQKEDKTLKFDNSKHKN